MNDIVERIKRSLAMSDAGYSLDPSVTLRQLRLALDEIERLKKVIEGVIE